MAGAAVWHLPSEVLVHVFSFLPPEDISRVASVCSRWSQLAEDRRVWRSKSFLSEGIRVLSDSLPITRALPVLKRVSISWGKDPIVYLNGELADFVVPDLKDEAVTSAISTLVMENLSVDFCLLEERCSNCLIVHLHELKHLKICATRSLLLQETIAAKLQPLCNTLSREPLSKLQSVDIHTNSWSMKRYANVNGNILGALSTCCALEWVTINAPCFLPVDSVTDFSKLQFLQLQNSTIEDVSFLDLCPTLRSLSLDNCSVLGRWEVSRTSELRSLILCHLSVTTEFVATLCEASPMLERMSLDVCPCVAHILYLGLCPQLCFLEVSRCDGMSSLVAGLPSGLQHLRLDLSLVTSDYLAEVLQVIPQLEVLDIIYCNVESLRFLRHCPQLLELCVASLNTFRHFYELGGLRGLKKLSLCYNDRAIGPLVDVLCKMPQLEVLRVFFMKSITNLSFLQYCHRLDCLKLYFLFRACGEHLSFHELSNLKKLRNLELSYEYLCVEDLSAVLPNLLHLEELCIGCMHKECNFSFLQHCHQLKSFQISCHLQRVSYLTQLRQLERLRRLTVVGLSDEYRLSLAEEVLRLPKLEYLGLEKDGPNFLESWEWRKMPSSVSLSAESESNLEGTP